jgi:carboxypeptidase Taq
MKNSKNDINANLNPLLDQLKEIAHLNGIQSLLHWDQETKMPKKAIGSRTEQLGAIASIIHRLHSGNDFKNGLKQCVDLKTGECIIKNATDLDKRLLKEVHRDWVKSVCLPETFVREYQETISISQNVWADARIKNDFKLFLPYLEKVVNLSTQKIDFYQNSSTYDYQKELNTHPYNFLLDEYEPNMTVDELDPLFNKLEGSLKGLLQKIQAKSESPKKSGIESLHKTKPFFEEKGQWNFGIQVLKDMGYDFDKGYQEKSSHPFTINFHPSDVRITTRFKTNDLFEGLSGSIHEGGHALYEQGLLEEWFGTPFCESTSLGIHESQSRFWENIVGKSESFWSVYYPILKDIFPSQLKNTDCESFYHDINSVNPGEIRVEADEVTYNFHILIRYNIEKKLIEKSLAPKDLPDYWNSAYSELLGVSPSSDANGVLQDVHWSSGGIGYFPTYTLGNIYASQFYEAMSTELNVEECIRRKQLGKIKNWLNQNIHQYGRRYSAKELVSKITNSSISIDPLISYLDKKYSG